MPTLQEAAMRKALEYIEGATAALPQIALPN